MRLRRAGVAWLASLALAAATGCYHYRFTTGSEAGSRRVQQWQHIWGFGGAPGPPFDLEKACGGGEVAEFGSYVSAGNVLAALGTLSFYAPRTAYAVCAK